MVEWKVPCGSARALKILAHFFAVFKNDVKCPWNSKFCGGLEQTMAVFSFSFLLVLNAIPTCSAHGQSLATLCKLNEVEKSRSSLDSGTNANSLILFLLYSKNRLLPSAISDNSFNLYKAIRLVCVCHHT